MQVLRNTILIAFAHALLFGLSYSPALAASPQYIPFPEPPNAVSDAKRDQALRDKAVVDFMACGSEAKFFDLFIRGAGAAGEGIGQVLIGKMTWLREHGGEAGGNPSPCSSSTFLSLGDVPLLFAPAVPKGQTRVFN